MRRGIFPLQALGQVCLLRRRADERRHGASERGLRSEDGRRPTRALAVIKVWGSCQFLRPADGKQERRELFNSGYQKNNQHFSDEAFWRYDWGCFWHSPPLPLFSPGLALLSSSLPFTSPASTQQLGWAGCIKGPSLMERS